MAALEFVHWLTTGILGQAGASYSDRLMTKAIRRAGYKSDNYVIETIGNLASDAFESTYPGMMVKKTVAASPVLAPVLLSEKKSSSSSNSRKRGSQARHPASKRERFYDHLESVQKPEIMTLCKNYFTGIAVPKYCNTTFNISPISAVTPNFQSFASINQGTGPTNLVGQRIQPLRLEAFCYFTCPTANCPEFVRLIVWRARRTGASFPAATDIVNAVGLTSQYNAEKVPSEYEILWDLFLPLHAESSTSSAPEREVLKTFDLSKGPPIIYQPSTGSGAMNTIGAMVYSLHGTGQIVSNWQLHYIDM